jgi:uncharacterized protein HemX
MTSEKNGEASSLSFVAIVIAAAIAIGGTTTVWQAVRANRAQQLARAEAVRATQAETAAKEELANAIEAQRLATETLTCAEQSQQAIE